MQNNEEQYISEQIPVPTEFHTVFSHFYKATNHRDTKVSKTFIPSFQTILVFSFGEAVSFTTRNKTTVLVPKCLLIGPVKQPFDYTMPAGAEILVANFKGDAFYRFFGNAILNGLPVNPDDLLNENCFTHLWQQLSEIKNTQERVQYILNFSRPYLKKQDALIERLDRIGNNNTQLNLVKMLASETRQSERAIQARHKKLLGYSAKEINRYQRFLKAVEILQASLPLSQKPDWFEVIHECGYYDQSQLIHDFKHYLDLSPTQFLKFQEEICLAQPA